MLDDVKLYDGYVNVKSGIKNTSSVKIVRCSDMKSIPDRYQGYVLQMDKDFNFYLSEIPLINHEYNYGRNICFLYDDMSENDKIKYQDKVMNVILRDSTIVRNEAKKKVRKIKK